MAHASDERCRRSHASHRCRCGAWIGIVNVVQLGIERCFSPGDASRQLLLFLAIGQLVSRIPLAFIADRRISAHLSAHLRAHLGASRQRRRDLRRFGRQATFAGLSLILGTLDCVCSDDSYGSSPGFLRFYAFGVGERRDGSPR